MSMLPVEIFLQEETRCDFRVSREMKQLWKVQLDILEVIIKICRKYKLKYCLYAGSMLGAARHKGFIPWDDDLDICMLRKDYDTFLKVAPNELTDGLFLQTALSSRGLPRTFAKVRNSNTAFIEGRVYNHVKENMGIFVDIFPLDAIYSDVILRKKVYKKYRNMFNILRLSVEPRFKSFDLIGRDKDVFHKKVSKFLRTLGLNLRNLILHPLCKVIVWWNGGYEKFYEKVEDVFRKLPQDKTDSICDCTFCAISNLDAKVYLKKWFDNLDYINMPFEYLSVMMPKDYDKILINKFGDWHKMIRGGSFHDVLDFSAERSYKDILIEKYGYNECDFL